MQTKSLTASLNQRAEEHRTKILAACGFLLAATCSGCGVFVATDGQVFDASQGRWGPEADLPWLRAVRASGAHDLNCPVEQVKARYLQREDYLADGCGQRATYTTVGSQLVLMSRFPLPAAPPAGH